MASLLLATVFLPIAGAILARLLPSPRGIALATTLATLTLAGVLVIQFPGGTEPFAVSEAIWAGAIELSLGLDGLSVWFFGLTALLMAVSVLVSWEAIGDRRPSFYGLLLLLESGMLGVFAARDIILFYVFFEFTLIPLFFLIGVWGSEERRYAAIKFFLFTLAGSVLTLLGLVTIVVWNYAQTGAVTFGIERLIAGLAAEPMWPWLQVGVFLLLFAGFAIKVPLVPLHTWLPLAHVQAPTAGSVILAGVLLKVGTYGFARFALPMTPAGTAICMPLLLWLSAIGIVYGALVALAQQDIKRLIAYSSVSHLGFCMLGLFALNPLGVQGGVLQMINHGLSTGGLFAVVGMLYERYHTRQIKDLSGLAREVPMLAAMMVLLTLASIGLPGLNGFAGEFLLLLGMFQRAWADAPAGFALQYRIISVLALSGVVLGAWYMLRLIQQVFFGPYRVRRAESDGHAGHVTVSDLTGREALALAPLVFFIFWIGLQPQFFLDRMAPTLARLAAPAAEIVANDQARPGLTLAARQEDERAQ